MSQKTGRRRTPLILTLALVAVTTAVYLFPESRGPQGLLTRLERLTYDMRLRIRGIGEARPEVVIVTIDDESINLLDKRIADFNRHDYARVIRNLNAAGAAIIGVDVLFTKPAQSKVCAPVTGATEALVLPDSPEMAGGEPEEDAGAETAGDETLAEAEAGSAADVVEEEQAPSWDLSNEDQDLAAAVMEGGNVVLARYVSGGVAQQPLDMFLQGAYGQAMITLTPDGDGTVRSLPLVEIQPLSDGTIDHHFTMGYAVVAPFLEQQDLQLELTNYGARLGGIRLYGAVSNYFINYIGPSNTFTRVPFGRIWAGQFEPEEVQDKIILIGNVHPSAHDYYSTPFDLKDETEAGDTEIQMVATQMPGIEIHANVAQSILNGRHVRFLVAGEVFSFLPAWTDRYYSAVWLALIGLVLGWIFVVSKLSIPVRVTLFVLLFGGYAFVAQLLLERADIMLQVSPYLAMFSMTFLGGVVYTALSEGAEKARITRTFGQYVSPQVVAELVNDPSRAQLGGEKKIMTVMFSDIRGFTTLSEKMDPVALVNFLNEYLSAMTDIIFEYKGVVDKYMGDAIMAFWGAPLEIPNHAEEACVASLRMMERLREMQAVWAAKGLPPLDIGIGLNTGPMTVGNMGSHVRFDYTVMGDSVNLGSRLEGINKEYGTHIVISEFTRKQLPDGFVCRELDLVAVKGKKEPVRIFELVASRPDPAWSERLELYKRALDFYKNRRFDEARAGFETVAARWPDDGPSKMYIKRCETLVEEPPPEMWDGVYVMKTK